MFLRSTRMRRAATLLACGSLGAALLAGAPARAQDPEPVSVVEIQVSDRAELDRLVNTAADVTEHVEVRDGDKYVQIVTTDSELALLRAQGFQIGRTVDTETQMKARQRGAERQLRAAADFDGIEQNVAEGEHIKILRADHFTNLATQRFISIEAKTDAGATDALTVRWDSGPGTEMGSGGSTTLDPFVDAGKYLYHRRQISVAARPDKVEVVSSATTERLVGTVEDWAPPTDDTGNPELVDFVDGYLDPTQAYDRIKQLASDYPNLAEIVELPYQTNGYRRKSMAQFGIGSGAGATPGSVVVVESKNYGSEGGDNVKVTLRNPGTASAPLTVNVNRDTIVVDLATNAAGAPVSTAKQVVDAINARSGSPAIAFTYRGSVGDGVVAPAPETRLEDNLNAPAHVSRKPHPMYAIRIGADRSGDKIGVYAYAQEHAREWVGPLVAVETAERLVRNYAVDPDVPRAAEQRGGLRPAVLNPDGGHYSFYDFTGQRKNMVDYCDDAERRSRPPQPVGRRPQPQLLRRHVFDGYVGGSRELHERQLLRAVRVLRAGDQERRMDRRHVPEHPVLDERPLLRQLLHVAAGGVHAGAGDAAAPDARTGELLLGRRGPRRGRDPQLAQPHRRARSDRAGGRRPVLGGGQLGRRVLVRERHLRVGLRDRDELPARLARGPRRGDGVLQRPL